LRRMPREGKLKMYGEEESVASSRITKKTIQKLKRASVGLTGRKYLEQNQYKTRQSTRKPILPNSIRRSSTSIKKQLRQSSANKLANQRAPSLTSSKKNRRKSKKSSSSKYQKTRAEVTELSFVSEE